MDKIDAQVLKVIKEAIVLEIRGRQFFTHASSMTEEPLGKKMFDMLAGEEVEHLKAFTELFNQETGGDDWKAFVREEEKKASPLVERLKERMAGGGKEKRAGELEAIRIGMDLERSAIDFFEKVAEESGSGKARELASTICEQERGHYDLLQAQYDSVHNNGFWLDSAEFRLDGMY